MLRRFEMYCYLAGDSLPAQIERAHFAHPASAVVERAVDVWYAIEPAAARVPRSAA